MPEPETQCNPVLLLRRFFDEQHADRIGLAATALWFCLLRHADDTGLSYPSHVTIARECGLSSLGVRKAITSCVNAGMVKIEKPGMSHSTARYRVLLPPCVTQLPETMLPETQFPVTMLPTSGNSVTPKVPIKKPSRVHVPPTPKPVTDAEAFYQAYPKHVNHKDTLDKYASLSKQNRLPEHAALMAALDRHKDYWIADGTETRFIPAPNVWLNKHKWEDELQDVNIQAAPAKPNGKRFTPAVPGSIPEQTYSYPEPPAALLAEWQAGLEKLRARFAARGGMIAPDERLATLAELTPISRNGDGILRIGARDRNTAKFAREYYHDDLAAVFGAVAVEP